MLKKLFLITALFATPAFAAEAIVTGPQSVERGDFIILNASNSIADTLIWIPDPKLGDSQSMQCAEKFATAIANDGEYYFHLVAIDNDGNSVTTHKIVVGSGGPNLQFPKIEQISYNLSRSLGDRITSARLAEALRDVSGSTLDEARNNASMVIAKTLLTRERNEQRYAWFDVWTKPLYDEIEKLELTDKNTYLQVLRAIANGLEKTTRNQR